MSFIYFLPAEISLAVTDILKQFETLQAEREAFFRGSEPVDSEEASDDGSDESDYGDAEDDFLHSEVGACHRRFICEVLSGGDETEMKRLEVIAR